MHIGRKSLLAACAAILLSGAALASPALADFPPYAHVVGIALVAPLTGDKKALGIQLSNGVVLAIDEINDRRGLADFGYVFHSFDDQDDPGIAQQQAEFTMVDPLTSIVVGHVGGEATFLAEQVYHEKGVPLIIPTLPFAQLTRRGYDNIFRLCPTDVVEGQQAARYAERTLHAKKAAIVYEETDYGADAGAGFVDYAGSGKALVAKDFSVHIDLKNLSTIVADVKAYAPDVLYLSGNGIDEAAVLSALRTAGITAPALGSQALYDERVAKAAGPGADQLIVSACVPPIEFVPTAVDFIHRYTARYGRPTSYSLMGYVAAQIAMSAIQQIRSSDKQQLIRELSVGSFPTILGNYSFTRGGDVANPIVYFYQWSNGAFKYLSSSYPNPLVAH